MLCAKLDGNLLTTKTSKVAVKKRLAQCSVDTMQITWGTGIRGLMRGMVTLPQGNQELLVVRDKVGRPQVSLG